MRERLTTISLTVILAAFVLAGCSSDDSPVSAQQEQAPPLPSVETMRLDISFFESAGVPPEAIEAGAIDGPVEMEAGGTRINFLNAAVRVLFLDVVVYSALVEPVIAFGVTIRSVPQRQDDGSWLWTYIFVEDEVEYAFYLYGKDEVTYVSWRFEVSTDDPAMPLDHFTWFSGEVDAGGDSGYWQFYEPAGDGAALAHGPLATPGTGSIRIDWVDNGAAGGSLVLLVNKAGDPAEGSTLTFEEVTGVCTVEFFDAVNMTNGTILWRADGTGHIEWPDYRGGERSCWDARQFDIDCVY